MANPKNSNIMAIHTAIRPHEMKKHENFEIHTSGLKLKFTELNIITNDESKFSPSMW